MREINQDTFALRPDLGLYVIADGMGGHADGEVASALAIEAIPHYFEQRGATAQSDAQPLPPDPSVILVGAVQHAHARIRARPAPPPWARRMGTTIAAVYVEQRTMFVAHVGDSRVYRLRDRRLDLLTQDHNRLSDYLNMGSTHGVASQMRDHLWLTRALGTQERVDVDTRREETRPGDVLLLCTDGLSNVVSDEQIALVLAGKSDVDATAAALMSIADARAASDDVTCVVLRWGVAVAPEADPDHPLPQDIAPRRDPGLAAGLCLGGGP